MTFQTNVCVCDVCAEVKEGRHPARFPVIFASGQFEEPEKTTYHACDNCYPFDDLHRVKEIRAFSDGVVAEVEFHMDVPEDIENQIIRFIESEIL